MDAVVLQCCLVIIFTLYLSRYSLLLLMLSLNSIDWDRHDVVCKHCRCAFVSRPSSSSTMGLKFLVPRVQVELGLVRDGTEAKNALGGTSSSWTVRRERTLDLLLNFHQEQYSLVSLCLYKIRFLSSSDSQHISNVMNLPCSSVFSL